MEQPNSQNQNNQENVIGAQCIRPELISGKTYTRSNYPGQPLLSYESYTREQACGSEASLNRTKREQEFKSNPATEEPSRTLMEKLEEEGMAKVQNLWKSGQQFNADKLMDIMKQGSDEFLKKNGRIMTYSELRRLYG